MSLIGVERARSGPTSLRPGGGRNGKGRKNVSESTFDHEIASRIEEIMSVRVQHRTRMFARVLGPFFAIVTVVVALRAPDMRQLLSEFTASDVWPWVTGAFILMGGIAIVAFHQLWRGPAAIIISVIGWVLVARGVFLLAFP